MVFSSRSQKNTKAVIYENIKKGVYTFFTPFWDSISADAKSLITQMLQYSPNRRCSAEEMLRHPWLRVSLQMKYNLFIHLFVCTFICLLITCLFYCSQDTDNMVDHLRGNGSDSLARKFHDHIQSRCRAKNTISALSVSVYSYVYVRRYQLARYVFYVIDPSFFLQTTALDRRVHHMHHTK